MRKNVRVITSDVSGAEIPESEVIEIKIPGFPRSDQVTVVDASRAEIEQLFGGAGTVQGRRGRKSQGE